MKKLQLNKETIASLNEDSMNQVKGGFVNNAQMLNGAFDAANKKQDKKAEPKKVETGLGCLSSKIPCRTR